MNDAILWYLVSSMLGWLAFPIAYRLLPNLPDRGYTASRALGLLIWSYSLWLSASLGILPFNEGGLLVAVGLLAGLSLWALLGIQPTELLHWLRSRKRMVWISETLFLAAFAGWVVVRAANPEALGTEKPMELAFINAILRSSSFPPHDPWLSGYAISYYYFGYVMMAMMAKITETAGSVAFNLGTTLIFAMSACGAYGLVYNLLNVMRSSNKKRNSQIDGPAPLSNSPPEASFEPIEQGQAAFSFAALLGPLYVLIVSNLEGFLHLLHTRGLFWVRNENGVLESAIWRWLDIQDLNLPPIEPFTWIPTRFWWWWRASRVLQDYDLTGATKEIIDEFPFFSFLLADLHPHVLAMPFAFLAITLAMNIFLDAKTHPARRIQIHLKPIWITLAAGLSLPAGLLSVALGAVQLSFSLLILGVIFLFISGMLFLWLYKRGDLNTLFSSLSNQGWIAIHVSMDLPVGYFLLTAIALGGMAFLNAWDFPVYVFIFAAAFALNHYFSQGQNATGPFIGQSLKKFLWMGLALGASGILLYLPFFLGFSSQAGGILPNLIYPTRGVHLWVMFGPLLAPIFVYLIYQLIRNWTVGLAGETNDTPGTQSGEKLIVNWRSVRTQNFRARDFVQSGGLLLGLWALTLLLGLGITLLPEVGQYYTTSLGADKSTELLLAGVMRRFAIPGTWITIWLMLGLIISLLRQLGEQVERRVSAARRADIFTLLLIFTGLMLILAPEFIYLRDLFGWRMNTIFKFYFQAWLLWSIAAAYTAIFLILKLVKWWGTAFRLVFILTLFASLTYPIFSLWSKTDGFQRWEWSLDSSAYFGRQWPEEMAAINWLKSAPFGVVAEAISPTGGSYTEYARVSTLSGLPAVLGWAGHEDQWRGSRQVLGSRQSDIERLYCTRAWEDALSILEQYQIRYVFVGNLERSTYSAKSGSCPFGLIEEKFQRNLTPVFAIETVVIYEYNNGQSSSGLIYTKNNP